MIGILYSRWIWAGLSIITNRSGPIRFLVRQMTNALSPLSRALRNGTAVQAWVGFPPRLFLFGSLALAGLVAYFPYRADLNPGGVPVGLDVQLYINWLSQMLGRSLADALSYSFSGFGPSSRPLLLILMYSASLLLRIQPDVLVKSLPVFLAMGLVASSYLLVRLAGAGQQMAVLTALLTASSSAVTVGIWASYYANWLALIEAYLLLGVLLNSVRSPSAYKGALLVALSLALLFTHPWTWILIMVVIGGFIASRWKYAGFRPLLLVFVGILLANIVAESVKTLVLNAFGAPAAGAYLVGQTRNPFGNFVNIWPNTIDGIILTYDGLLATTIVLGLALLYTLKLRYVDDFQRLLFVWVLVSSVPFSFLPGYFQTRVIYDMPISVLAAGGLMVVMSSIDSRSPLRYFLLVAVVLLTANYALQSMLIA